MALISLGKKYWLRCESGLIDSSLTRFYCQFITKPNIGVFLKVARIYKSMDTQIYSPMEKFDLLVFIVPLISRPEFDEVVSKVYNKKKADRGSKDAFLEIARHYELTCLYYDEWNGDSVLTEIGQTLKIKHWNGSNINNISSTHIHALADTLKIEQEWEPSPAHPSWKQLTRRNYC